MLNLETIVKDIPKVPSFVINQFEEVGKAYVKAAKKPYLLPKGLFEMGRDIVNVPISYFKKSDHKDFKEILDSKLSQALGISEAMALGGRYLGVNALKIAGADDYTASIVGGNVGDYLFTVSSFMGSYFLLTHNHYSKNNYPKIQAVKDGYKMLRDILFFDFLLHIGEGPVLGSLVTVGLGPNAAVTVSYAIHNTVYLAGAKQISRTEIT